MSRGELLFFWFAGRISTVANNDMFLRKYTQSYSVGYLYHLTRANSASWRTTTAAAVPVSYGDCIISSGICTLSALPHHRLYCAWSASPLSPLSTVELRKSTEWSWAICIGQSLKARWHYSLFSFVQRAFSHQTNLYSVCILMQIHYLLVVLFASSWQCLAFPLLCCLPFV